VAKIVKCFWCGRKLRGIKSVERGCGPVCFKKNGEGRQLQLEEVQLQQCDTTPETVNPVAN
jgi:hypothetical protein